MGIPLLAGRTFQDRDAPTAPPVAIVSAALARQYWPGESPIGKRLRFDDNPKKPWFTVVGIVGDVRQLGLRRTGAGAPVPAVRAVRAAVHERRGAQHAAAGGRSSRC